MVKTKTAVAKAAKSAKAKAKASKVGNDELSIDRRVPADRREDTDRRVKSELVSEERRREVERRKTPRRRQIDPTTCERDYTDAEIEFMQAMDDYKRANGRMFPTCSEILEVLRSIGYVKVDPSDAPVNPCEEDAPEVGMTEDLDSAAELEQSPAELEI